MSNKEKKAELMYVGSMGLCCIMGGFMIAILATMIGGWQTIVESPFRLFCYSLGIAGIIVGTVLTVLCSVIYNKLYPEVEQPGD